MSDRSIVGDKDKMAAWMRDIEDRVTALQTRKVQGAMTMQSLAVNSALRLAGAKDTLDSTWVNKGAEPQMALATASLTLATTAADIPGCLITPTRPGFYVVHAIFDITFSVAGNATAIGTCVVSNGTLRTTQGLFLMGAGVGGITRASVAAMGTWNVPDVSNARIGLQGSKNAAAATINTNAGNTAVLIWRAGPAQ